MNVPEGWDEFENGLITKRGPHGGIIDRTIGTEDWFVIFNRPTLKSIDDFPSRAAALEAFNKVLETT